MTYNPKVKVFYGSLGDSGSRLSPAPTISIGTELVYKNDIIIGYNYVFTLTGQITAIEQFGSGSNSGGTNPTPTTPAPDPNPGSSSSQFGLGSVIDHIHKIRRILSQNGNILTITNEYENEVPILKAKGGILRSFDISNSDNNWIHYAGYTATIEFQSVDFIGASWRQYTQEDCSSIFLSDSTYTKNNPGILDLSKFKIKSFEDSWNFNFQEDDAYNRIYNTETSNTLNIDNSGFTIDYTINATGKNAYVYTDEDTSEVKIVPAWEQAKNFVQYRLHNQITGLLNNVLNTNQGSECSPTGSLSSITAPGGTGLMNGLASQFEIFNETVTCDVSESEGTYSAKYSAIVKRNTANNYSSINTKHKVSKSLKTTNNNGVSVTNITIEGTIEGLLPGGLIRSPDTITLPQKGSFLSFNKNAKNIFSIKYDNAKTLLDKIYSDQDYNGGIGANGKRDLKAAFKNILNIDYNALNSSAGIDDTIPDGPHPISFNLTHDYISGTINYSVEYSSNTACGRKHREISIQTSSPTPVYAQFDIPNGGVVPIFQNLNTFTAQNVTVTITGINALSSNINILGEFTTGSEALPVSIPLPAAYILTSSQYTKNPIDGSFTATKSFICNTNGCFIN
jgi:hypothetical protein